MSSSGMLRRVVLTIATRRNIPEDDILYSHRHESLKSYTVITVPIPVTIPMRPQFNGYMYIG
jgi:hypothetical protein